MSSTRRAVLVTAVFCLVLQCVSATWVVRNFGTPNASMKIAKNLLETGRYEGGFWAVLKGSHGASEPQQPKLFQLPGQALYVAFLLRYVPPPLQRYAHVPITVLLVASVSCVAALAAGPMVGTATGILASVQPFILTHGPVWEDTFAAAALVWTVIGFVYAAVKGAAGHPFLVLALSGCASLLRSESQVILVLLGAAALLLPSMRMARAQGVAILAGVLIALVAWGTRNKLAVGEFTVTTTHDGVVLLLSNGPYTKQAVRYGQIDRYINAETMGAHFDAVAGMSELDTNRYYQREALKYMVANPWDVMTTAMLKVGVTLAGIRPEEGLWGVRNLPALAANGALLFLSVWWLYLVAVRSRIRVDPQLLWMFGIVGIVVLVVLAFGPIGWRYRITLDGVLWITSAWTLVYLFQHYARRRAEPLT